MISSTCSYIYTCTTRSLQASAIWMTVLGGWNIGDPIYLCYVLQEPNVFLVYFFFLINRFILCTRDKDKIYEYELAIRKKCMTTLITQS